MHWHVYQLLQHACRQHPELVAIECGNHSIRYAEMRDLAANIEARLELLKITGGGIVAVVGHRSIEVIAASMAVWSSARILMLIDDSLPKDRQALMLENVPPVATIQCGSDGKIVVELAHPSGIDALLPTQINQIDSNADHAYIAFTSGSTGVPKAILGSHNGLSHFLQWQRSEFGIGNSDRFGHFTNLSFDVWFRDAFVPLISGATLCIPESSHISVREALEFLATRAITALHIVPSVANHWINGNPSHQAVPHLRLAFFAGEPLEGVLVRRWLDVFPACQVVNLYGPTETTLAKHFKRISHDVRDGIQAVGHPIPGSSTHILDDQFIFCPDGVQGEICIETPYCSHGYLTKGGLVSPFIETSLAGLGLRSIYRTGDLGLRKLDGDIEILGRKDDQVKINGMRIELLEIKSFLVSYPGVMDAFVCVTPDRHTKSIVAFVESGWNIADKLLKHLRNKLPSAMVPARILIRSSLPRLSNGKINRAELISLAISERQTLPVPVDVPGKSVSGRVENIWKRLLGLDQVDHYRNFFDSGGNSLSIVELHATLESEFKIRMPLVRLFDHASLNAQVDLLAGLIEGSGATPFERVAKFTATNVQRARTINAHSGRIRRAVHPQPQLSPQEENNND